MRGSPGFSTISRLAAVAAVLCLGAGPAWAGAGGESGGGQAIVDSFCALVGMTSCPQLPTISQAVLEIAALTNSAPDYARTVSVGECSVSGTDLLFPSLPCSAIAVSAANRPVLSANAPPKLDSIPLSSLSPLAFAAGVGQAVPVPPGGKGANSFFYAVTSGTNGQPNALDLFFDYPPQTTPTFAKGPVAKISLPLQVLNADGSERPVCGAQHCPASVATLVITAQCTGSSSCLTAAVTGDFGSGTQQTYNANALGVSFALLFGPTPNANQGHATLAVQVPLLVTGPVNPTNCGAAINSNAPDPADCGNDPAYFGVVPTGATLADGVTPNPNVGSPTGINQLSGLPTAFATNDLGFAADVLGGASVGIAPSAAPQCSGGSCPATPVPSTFPFCASFISHGVSQSAVAAFATVGTDGTAYVTSPVGPTAPVACPPF